MLRSRRNLIAALVVLVTAGTALLAGCGSSGSTHAVDYQVLPGVRGVRTADGGKALVVAYTAGACHKPAKPHAVQTASVVTLTAALPKGCATGKVDWALKFPLTSAVGARAVHTGVGGAAVAVFDGDVLTDPRHLPGGYRQQSETQGPLLPGSWTRNWVPGAGAVGDELQITQTSGLLPAPAGVLLPGRHLVGKLPAVITRDAATRTLTVQWVIPGRHRSTRVAAVQLGAQPTLTVTELLVVAASLPVHG